MLLRSSYGWVVVLCAFTLMFVGFGAFGSYSAPILGAVAFAFIAAAGVFALLRTPPSPAAA